MAILVTGGTGYIGSHTCIELDKAGYDVIIVDNLVNSKIEVLNRLQTITGKMFKFYKEDVCDKVALDKIFTENKIDGVIHFAGLKAVGESVKIPLAYYQNNLFSTINLLEVMSNYNIKNFVFSSSATVYGDPATVPIKETFPLSTTNPYGATKLMIEGILKDYAVSDPTFQVAILRYFNPVGADLSGLIGEDPTGIPNNLVPYIAQVAVGKLDCLAVFGDDYNTPDGTGVRDYIHVKDLALGHIAALKKLETKPGCVVYNLGTGIGYSVLDMVKSFERVSGKKIPYKISARRAGDIATCYGDPEKAFKELGFKAGKNLDDMLRDSWNWQSKNPNGYEN